MSDSEEDIFKTASDSESDNDDDNSVKIKDPVESDDEKDEVVQDENDDEVPVEEDDEVEVQASDDDDDSIDEDVVDLDESKPVKIKAAVLGNSDEEDSDEENDDDDENYLQKFDSQIKENYVNVFHPECVTHNYQEISSLTKVIRDKNNIIIDPLHRTLPFLTKYEYARIVGQRAKQINSGAKPFIKVPENVIEGSIIAEMELAQKRIPFIIRRPFPGGGCEYWNLKDLELVN